MFAINQAQADLSDLMSLTAEVSRINGRRLVFASFLRNEIKRFNYRARWDGKYDDAARWLANCQNYGIGCHAVIDVFVEAEGGGVKGWGQVWSIFGQILVEDGQ